MNIDITKQMYLVAQTSDDQTVWFRCPGFTMVCGFEELLTKLANNKGMPVPAAFTHDDLPVKIVAAQGHTTMACQLKSLPFNTNCSTFEGKIFPDFKPTPNSMFRRLVWLPPANMKLWLAIKANQGDNAKWQVHETYLFAQHTTKAGFFKLPLPNIYDHGKMCAGNMMLERLVNMPTLFDLWVRFYVCFRGSDWNSDLIPDMGKSRAMFQFSAADNTPLPCPEDWTPFCKLFDNFTFQEVTA